MTEIHLHMQYIQKEKKKKKKKTHLLILPETLRVPPSFVLSFFLNILGSCSGSNRRSQEKKKTSDSVLLLLLPRHRLPRAVAPAWSLLSLWLLSDTLSHTFTSAPWQPLPDRFTGVSPPRHPPCTRGPDRPVPSASPALSFHPGAQTHSPISHKGPGVLKPPHV